MYPAGGSPQPQSAYAPPQPHASTPSQPYSPYPANHGAPQGAIDPAAPVAGGKSKAPLFIGIGVGAVALIAVIAVAAGGGGGGSGSEEDLLKATIAALSEGDVDALVKLSDPENAISSAVECEKKGGSTYGMEEELKREAKELRRKHEESVDQLAGAKLELVDFTSKKREQFSKGDRIGEGCTAKTDLAEHRAKVTFKATDKKGDGKPYEGTVEIRIIQVGSRYYLERIRDFDLAGGGAANEALTKLGELSNRMCACRDKACAEGVNDDYKKWGTEMARNAKPQDARAASPDQLRQMTEYATKYTDCFTKLAVQGY